MITPWIITYQFSLNTILNLENCPILGDSQFRRCSFFSFATYADTISAPLSRPFSQRGSLFAFSSIRKYLPSPFSTRFPNPQVGMVFLRLSTRHLFAGAIWKFNACALTGKITAIPTSTHCAFETISHISRPPRAHVQTNTRTRTRAHAFPTAENSDRTLSSRISHVDLVTRCCRYMDTSVSYVVSYTEFY